MYYSKNIYYYSSNNYFWLVDFGFFFHVFCLSTHCVKFGSKYWDDLLIFNWINTIVSIINLNLKYKLRLIELGILNYYKLIFFLAILYVTFFFFSHIFLWTFYIWPNIPLNFLILGHFFMTFYMFDILYQLPIKS